MHIDWIVLLLKTAAVCKWSENSCLESETILTVSVTDIVVYVKRLVRNNKRYGA